MLAGNRFAAIMGSSESGTAATTCALCGQPVESGPAWLVTRSGKSVCWNCMHERERTSWGQDQLENVLVRLKKPKN